MKHYIDQVFDILTVLILKALGFNINLNFISKIERKFKNEQNSEK